MRESSLNCVPLMEDGRLRGLELDLRLTADTEERGWARRQDVERHVEETELRRLLAAVEQLQEWNADCLALGRRVCAARPEQRRLIWAQWAEVFPELEVRGRCTVSLTGWEQ